MKKKIIIPLVVTVGLAVIGLIAYSAISGNLSNNQDKTSFQTEPAKKGDINVTIGGTGTVQGNQTATISWQASGKVSNVWVKKGQQVVANAVLAELAENSLSQNLMSAKTDLVNAQRELDEAINNNQARADAHLAVVQAEQGLENAKKEAQSKLYQRASQETIDIAYANLINANQALDDAQAVWERTRGAGEKSTIYAAGLSQYAKARQEQQQAEYNYRYVSELPDPLKVEEANIKVDQAKAQLLAAKQEWEKVKDGPDSDKVLAAQTKLDIAQATLDLAHLTAPFAGTVTQIESQGGDLVNAGTMAIRLDDLSHLFVNVDISEVDIREIKIGQQVSITFDALPDKEFTGKVADIAEYGSSSNGTVNFTVTIEIQDATMDVKPGMTASINVTVNQLNDVLLIPSRAVRTVNGKRVVYLLENDQPLAVNITLGASANNYSQIVEGEIKAGDRIVINPPSSSMLPMERPGTSGVN